MCNYYLKSPVYFSNDITLSECYGTRCYNNPVNMKINFSGD